MLLASTPRKQVNHAIGQPNLLLIHVVFLRIRVSLNSRDPQPLASPTRMGVSTMSHLTSKPGSQKLPQAFHAQGRGSPACDDTSSREHFGEGGGVYYRQLKCGKTRSFPCSLNCAGVDTTPISQPAHKLAGAQRGMRE